jgi:sugar transferase EpsL
MNVKSQIYKLLFKRLFDLLLAFILILIFSPLLFVVALLILIFMGEPVLYRQTRPGLNAVPFDLYKFRTMTAAKGPDGNLLPDSERMTALGKIIRRYSIDELPQLFNVLAGQMSLVGPRPLLMEYLPLYSSEQFRRHEVKPGITGWAQVNGRNIISWKQRFELDAWYVDHWSFSVDLKILCMTLAKVFKREGINQPGQVTMEKFKGNI